MHQKIHKHENGFLWRNCLLNGVVSFKDAYKGKSCVIWGSGPSFGEYDDSLVPESWQRFSVNETIQLNFNGRKKIPDWWVLSDLVIVERYAKFCPAETKIISTHRSSEKIDQACPKNEVYKILAQPEPIEDFGDGYQFFSRRSVVIATVEVARYMGFKNVFIFGLDHFRLRSKYYYDGKEANSINERRCPHHFIIPGTIRYKGERLFQTPALREGIIMFHKVMKSGLWNNINVYSVNSPASQVESIPKMSLEEFLKEVELSGSEKENGSEPQKRKRGRPRKVVSAEEKKEPVVKRKRGRPRKEEQREVKGETEKEKEKENVPYLQELGIDRGERLN